ncbi:MAG: phosphoenolpyruvate--protein phosphotransferase [Gammaproteobacteria bacterium]
MLEVLHKIVQEVNTARDLHEVLDIILRHVQHTLKVDVCSVYLCDQKASQYVLMATVGLNPTAVGRLRIPFNEGIVGRVATRGEPVNLDNAPAHPDFKYIPESGEDPYHAYLGVPIIHQRDVLGVLVVQQRQERRFEDDDVSFLVTLAAHIAGAVMHAEISGALRNGLGDFFHGECRLQGIASAPGVAVGHVVEVFGPSDLRAVPDRRPDDIETEVAVFRSALAEVRKEIEQLRESLGDTVAEAGALFDAYLLLLSGEGIEDDTVARIRQGHWAPGALRQVIEEHAQVFAEMEDPYLRERGEDIRDLGARLLVRLQASGRGEAASVPDDIILVGDELGAAQLAEIPPGKLLAIVSGRGSSTSHVAILARAMGIPAVMGVAGLPLGQLEGEEIIVDGYRGRIYLRPAAPLRSEYRRLAREEQELNADLQGLRDEPSVTTDGRHLPLLVNTALLSDIEPALRSGTEGVGLYRTEIPFLVRDSFPSEDEQFKNYRKVLKVFHPRPVTLRTLDIGGDKPLPYFSWEEENPYLGWRGLRVTLDHPEIFRIQLRAMLRADVGLGNMRVMFPMVTTSRELSEAVRFLDETVAELREDGLEVVRPPVGVMVEVPALLFDIDEIARQVDFLSVGTNDLTQYLMAVDRNNPRVADRYDSLHPAMLRALARLIEEAHRLGRPVSICGEMAGNPAAALLLLGLGVDGLSLNVASLPRVKWLVRSFAYEEAKNLAQQALTLRDSEAVVSLTRETIEARGLGGLVRAGK